MGRPKQNKRRQPSNSKYPKHYNKNAPKNKRQRQERFWIEDCQETTAPEGTTRQMEVLITRIELTDDYTQAPKPNEEVQDTDKDVVEKKTTHVKDSEQGESAEVQDDASPQDTSYDKSTAVNKELVINSEVTKGELDSDKAKSKDENAPVIDTNQIVEQRNEDAADAQNSSDKADASSEDEGDVERQPVSALGEAKAIIEDLMDASNPFICVKKSKNVKTPVKRIFKYDVKNFKPLPNGDCGDGIVNPYPKVEVPDKFWSQRRRLFTRFDEGIQLDKESWYSVTPEAIANHIAAHLVGSRRNVTILDPFCGCGGNAIAFALREEVDLVVCVDTDLEKLKKAASNARIYGISKEKMVFIHDDASQVLSCYKNGNRTDSNPSEGNASVPCFDHCEFKIGELDLLPKDIDMIFMSPPWGGMDYGKVGKRNYDLTCIKVEGKNKVAVDGESLLDFAAKALGQKPMAIFLPRNINGIALGKSSFRVGYNEGPLILEQNILNGKLKTVTAYLGLGSS